MTERIVFAIEVRKVIGEQIRRRIIAVRRIRRRDNSRVGIVEVNSSREIIRDTASRRISKATPYNAIRDVRNRVI